jgi:spermidine synthase
MLKGLTRRSMLGAAVAFLGACAGRDGVIFETQSEFNHIVVLEDGLGRRMLSFGHDGAIQTIIYPKEPTRLVSAYTRTSMCALALHPRPQRVLVIGLGGGAMPTFLRHACPEAIIDVVELDGAVVDVARRFFNFKEDQKMKAHTGDGRKFIETTPNRYDLIFLDAFGEDSVPHALATKEFLAMVRSKLTEKGVAVSNVWGPDSNGLYPSMLKTHSAVFDELHVLHARPSDNRLIFAFPYKAELDRRKLIQLARTEAPKAAKELDLEALMGQLEPHTIDADAKVLIDAEPAMAK